MAVPATPAPAPRDDDSPTEPTTTGSEDLNGVGVRRRAVDLQWRPAWRGDEPDEVDQLLAPPR